MATKKVAAELAKPKMVEDIVLGFASSAPTYDIANNKTIGDVPRLFSRLSNRIGVPYSF